MFSEPCGFTEDQYLVNADYFSSERSRFQGHFFAANDITEVSFPGNGLNKSGNLKGFPSAIDTGFRVLSIAHTFAISANSLNEARLGFVRTRGNTTAQTPLRWSDLGVAAGSMNNEDGLPSLNVVGSISFASGLPRTFTQNNFWLTDDFSRSRGKHAMRIGGSLARLQNNVAAVGIGSLLQFLSWPDLLLGLSAKQNGSAFSNILFAGDDYGLLDREYRSWEASTYGQDDWRISEGLTFNFGLRYELLGQLADRLGRNASFDINKADANPPAQGSANGYIVASNFSGNTLPGVIRATNHFGNYALGQNTIAPRIGFAWQLAPGTSSLVIRGGYGLYFSRPSGQAFSQSVTGAPFSLPRFNTGAANATATLQTPFPQPFPNPGDFPLFPLFTEQWHHDQRCFSQISAGSRAAIWLECSIGSGRGCSS